MPVDRAKRDPQADQGADFEASRREPAPLLPNQLKSKAVRWLSVREHTRHELAQKLARFCQDEADLDRVLDDLEREGWQSDHRAARSLGRVKATKQGNALIAQQLRQKGISQELIESTLESIEGSELQRAHEVWAKKFGRQGVAEDFKERARQARFLASRGFSSEVIRKVIGGDSGELL